MSEPAYSAPELREMQYDKRGTVIRERYGNMVSLERLCATAELLERYEAPVTQAEADQNAVDMVAIYRGPITRKDYLRNTLQAFLNRRMEGTA